MKVKRGVIKKKKQYNHGEFIKVILWKYCLKQYSAHRLGTEDKTSSIIYEIRMKG